MPSEKFGFKDLFLQAEDDDEASLGLAELLLAVKKTWPNGVMPRNVAACIAPDFMPPSEQAREMLGCLEQASGKPLHPLSSSSITWALK